MRRRFDLPRTVAVMRFHYHTHMIDLVNVGNQLHLIKDDRAEEMNKNHVMTIFNDIAPRLGMDIDEIVKANCNE